MTGQLKVVSKHDGVLVAGTCRANQSWKRLKNKNNNIPKVSQIWKRARRVTGVAARRCHRAYGPLGASSSPPQHENLREQSSYTHTLGKYEDISFLRSAQLIRYDV